MSLSKGSLCSFKDAQPFVEITGRSKLWKEFAKKLSSWSCKFELVGIRPSPSFSMSSSLNPNKWSGCQKVSPAEGVEGSFLRPYLEAAGVGFSHCWWKGWWQHLHTTTSSCRQPSQELWPWEGEWCWHWLPHFHCLPVVSLHAYENRPWLSASKTLRNMLFYEIFVSNHFQQLFGIFYLSRSLSCTSSPPFQRGCVTCRNVELKGPEFLQQEFVLEASESEGEETGSPPRASAGLSHPFSKLQPGQLMSWGWACFQWG